MNKLSSGEYEITTYNSSAHVFEIHPETKSSWLPKGNSTIPIAIVVSVKREEADSKDKVVKLVAVDQGNVVLESVILPRTVFTQRSEKFGQWTDLQTGAVYGLGFSSDGGIEDFMTAFKHAQTTHVNNKDGPLNPARPATAQPQVYSQQVEDETRSNTSHRSHGEIHPHYNSSTISHSTNRMNNQHQIENRQSQYDQSFNSASNVNGNLTKPTTSHSRTNGGTAPVLSKTSPISLTEQTRKLSLETDSPTVDKSDLQTVTEQLRYENERLKAALEETSKNAGTWEAELTALRTNNIKLTQALQESRSHVKEWERELVTLRNENKELANQVNEQNQNRNGNDGFDKFEKIKNDITRQLKIQSEEMMDELKTINDRITYIQEAFDVLKIEHHSKSNDDESNSDSEFQVEQNRSVS